jgi:hypothetical protein
MPTRGSNTTVASGDRIPQILDVLDGSDPRHAGSKPASENGLKDRVSLDMILAVTCD